jgi:hypothetical protein
MSTAITTKATRAWRRLCAGARRGTTIGLGVALVGGTVLGATGGAPSTAHARAATLATRRVALAVPAAGTTPQAPVVKSPVSVGGKAGATAPAPPSTGPRRGRIRASGLSEGEQA